MKQRIRLSEGKLRNIIREAVKNVLAEDDAHWTGDIKPKAIEGFREDSIESHIAEMKEKIEEYTENIKKAAYSGNSHQVRYYADALKIIADLINGYRLEL